MTHQTKNNRPNYFILIVLAAIFLNPTSMVKAFYNGQPADVVVGQPDMTSYDANQNNNLGPNTLNSPYDVYSDGIKLFIVDQYNNRVLIYNTIPTSNNTAADVVIGQSSMSTNEANQGGSVAANTLRSPQSVYYDGTKLFIADYGNKRVLIYNSIPTSNNASADVVIGQPNTSSANSYSVQAYSTRYAVNVYSTGTKLFIVDSVRCRVLIFNTIPTTDFAEADVVIGQSSMTNSISDTTAKTLNSPTGVFYDGIKLFISDSANHRVLIFNSIPTINFASADVVVGQTNMTSSSSGLSATNLYYPQGLMSDGNRLFIADYVNYRVLIHNTIPSIHGAAADIVIGKPDMTASSPSNGANGLNRPGSVYFTAGKLFVADSSNNRVLIYNDITLTPTPTRTITSTTTPTYTSTISPTLTSTVSPTPTLTPIYSKTITATRTLTPVPSITSTTTPYIIDKNSVINYPSPATGHMTKFYYKLNGQASVSIDIYNVVGEKIETLSSTHSTGSYGTTTWTISDVAPGMYMYILTIEDQDGARKIGPKKMSIVK